MPIQRAGNIVSHHPSRGADFALSMAGVPRANAQSRHQHTTADDCFTAMQRHHDRTRRDLATVVGKVTVIPATRPLLPAAAGSGGGGKDGPNPPIGAGEPGDLIYGAKAIAKYLFGSDDNRSRRRVFNLWAYYKRCKLHVGFVKLNGALCLSKSRWRRFHGLD